MVYDNDSTQAQDTGEDDMDTATGRAARPDGGGVHFGQVGGARDGGGELRWRNGEEANNFQGDGLRALVRRLQREGDKDAATIRGLEQENHNLRRLLSDLRRQNRELTDEKRVLTDSLTHARVQITDLSAQVASYTNKEGDTIIVE